MTLLLRLKGGEGSGNFDHAGRPGEVGGSAARPANVSVGKVRQSERDTSPWRDVDEIHDATNLIKDYYTIAVGLHKNVVYGSPLDVQHSYMLHQIDPKDTVDNYVRFNVMYGKLYADFIFAGVIFDNDNDYEEKKTEALNNIYNACDKLIERGLSEDTPLYITMHFRNPLELTVHKEIIEKQLPIDAQSRANLIAIRNGIFNSAVDTLAEKLYIGDISIGQWEEAMKNEIKSLHTSTAVIGKGAWEDMTQSDWGRVGQLTRQQYRYLHGFAETIKAEQDTISLRAMQARAHMYANAGKHTAAVMQAGEFAGGTRRQPGRFKGLPFLPGDGSTECLVNCKCHWSLTVIGTTSTSKLVQAVWHLTPAEHCDTCKGREDYTEIVKVPIDTVVPETIGLI